MTFDKSIVRYDISCRFVRKIIGLDEEAVRIMLADVYNTPSINPNQIRLLDKIVRHVVLNGVIDDFSVLMRDPFTEDHPFGIGAFGEVQLQKIKQVLGYVNESVAA